MKTFTCCFALTLLALLAASFPVQADGKVIVHEWGTFTCLQDENGQALGGINVDDEPVPDFVCGRGFIHAVSNTTRHAGGFGLPPYWDLNTKGWKPADGDATMRLETPVMYIYPPKGATPQSVPPLEVHVDFCGGLLTQFYPYADTSGFPADFPLNQGQHISDFTSGLTWKNIRLGSTEKPVETTDKVWTTPREVSAPVLQADAQVYNGGGGFNTEPQAEHFLFYRGIGHLDSPVKIALNGQGKMQMTSLANGGVSDISRAWVVKIERDGSCAWRNLDRSGEIVRSNDDPNRVPLIGLHASVMVGSWMLFPNFSAAFVSSDYAAANLAALKASMHDALVKEGLYDDEATAMLKTWELSYFKSPGLRFFYVVPRAWVDKELPLSIMGAKAEITRVMIGRIELISDAQRQALARLANGPCPDLFAIKSAADEALKKSALTKEEKELYYGGAKPLTDLGITLSPWVQDYLSLGRFRDALVVHEQQQHPSAALAQFIKDNGLGQL